MNATARISRETAETAHFNLGNVGDACARDEYAFAVGFAGTVHGLLYNTEARVALENLRDVLVDRIRLGEEKVPTGAIEAAYGAAYRALGYVMEEAV